MSQRGIDTAPMKAASRGRSWISEAPRRARTTASAKRMYAVHIVGVNQRDLRTLAVDRGLVERILPGVPRDVPVVAESGLSTREELLRLSRAGCRGFLIGTALMEADDPASMLRGWRS